MTNLLLPYRSVN